MRRTSTMPVTASPYIGSGLRIEWPPMITHPTSAALARPPRKIEETTLGLTRLVGKPTMFSAVNGRPPIAKISESELAAAIWPYENGSSTIGVKKSTVWTSARWRSRRYTPASSNVFELTSTWRSNEIGSCGKTCRRACWLNLEAHPAQDESDVSFRICSRDMWFTSFHVALVPPAGRWLQHNRKSAIENQKLTSGEDRNRTYLVPLSGTTTVLKTAGATRHPSLSTEKTPNAQRPPSNVQLDELSVER